MIENLTIHSGANDTKPNSKEYLIDALSCRYSFIEVDVRVSSDHICFLSHDGILNDVVLDTLKFEELKALDDDFLTLDDAIILMKKHQAKLNIDIKDDKYIDDIVECIERNHFEDFCVFSGTHLEGAKKIKKMNSKLNLIVNFEEQYYDDIEHYRDEYIKFSPYGININYLWMENPKFQMLEDTEIPIFTWTVDDLKSYAICKKNDVHNITTNHPSLFYEDFVR